MTFTEFCYKYRDLKKEGGREKARALLKRYVRQCQKEAAAKAAKEAVEHAQLPTRFEREDPL